MLLSLALLTLTLIGSASVLLAGIRNAPEGYQDGNGFHFKDRKVQVEYAHYNAFAGQQPKRYPARVSARRIAA
jgi:hypothetical protein